MIHIVPLEIHPTMTAKAGNLIIHRLTATTYRTGSRAPDSKLHLADILVGTLRRFQKIGQTVSVEISGKGAQYISLLEVCPGENA